MGRLRSTLVVFAAFLNLFISNGFNQGIGLFVVEWQDDFNDSSAEDIGWIYSFNLIGYGFAGKYRHGTNGQCNDTLRG